VGDFGNGDAGRDVIGVVLGIFSRVEGEFNANAAKEIHADPARCYSIARASLIPTTFIIKARKPPQHVD
jgi:hypothetical protein